MTKTGGITRRAALRGLGTVVALPWLESLAKAAPATASAAEPPVRAAFFYVPNGVHMREWRPTGEGESLELPWILQPLEPFKQELNVFTGLTLDKARPNGDGPGDHARAMAAFLTGRQPRKTHGADIRAGQSADQHIATRIGDQTRFASLELGIERGQQAGNCDSGYSCAYSSNLSWRGDATPNAKEVDPKQVFERLFGDGGKDQQAARAKRDRYNQSILDLVMEDARSLNNQLGVNDRRKVDEYLSAVRELEQRIERSRQAVNAPPPQPPKGMPVPVGVPKDMQEHVRLMMDLLVVAFQADLTRVATFPIANDGSNRPYPFIGVGEGHHDLSHHGNDKAKHEKLKKINRFHIEQFAYFLSKLRSVREGDRTLLDQVMVVYGSGISDGNRHNHDDLPVLLAGLGGRKLKGGRHIQVPRETPLMNLYLAMFDRLGVPAQRFGDSTGKLAI